MKLSFFFLRPDAIIVWRDDKVRGALEWYYNVYRDKLPARFLIARSIDAGEPLEELSEKALWKIHEQLHRVFGEKIEKIIEKKMKPHELSMAENSYLKVKVLLARKLASPCRLCERKCMADRERLDRKSICRLTLTPIVSSSFLHYGEEAPLVPSGTIFYGGCNFRCVYCQNHDISQERPPPGIPVDAIRLARIQETLRRRGARNINHVGGEPTPNIPVILESMLYLMRNVPQVWNSNFYMSMESVKLLIDVIDLWLPDFKYWDNKCAIRLSAAPRYRETVTRNLLMVRGKGDIIIRHLVLPGHVECCTKGILRWIADNMPREKTLVNIMDQYYPTYRVVREPERWKSINRRITQEEYREALQTAEKLGINVLP